MQNDRKDRFSGRRKNLKSLSQKVFELSADKGLRDAICAGNFEKFKFPCTAGAPRLAVCKIMSSNLDGLPVSNRPYWKYLRGIRSMNRCYGCVRLGHVTTPIFCNQKMANFKLRGI